MSFWQQALGNAPPVQQPQAPATSQPYSPSPFFQPYQAPASQQPQTVPGQPQPNGEVNQYKGTEQGAAARAQSAKITELCPECGSDEFFRPVGMPNMMAQCYACGYNGRFAHSTAGGGMPGGDSAGPSTPSRQTREGGRGGVSNYQAQGIIGKVG